MASNRKRIVVEFLGDDKDLSRSLSGTERKASSWGKKLGGFAKVAGLGLAGLGVAAVKFGMDFVEAAEESVKVSKQTAAVIKSTGGAAQVTAGQVGDLAEKLSLKAGIDDELIQSGANVLLTFRNIRNEVGRGNDIFDQATTLALDMSVAMGQDLQSSVVLVGKALNDPIRGLAALRRVGVQLTAQQEESIRKFVEQGDVMSAQKVILEELTTQFGGSAEAQATASEKLKVAFGNISEELGLVLLPYVNQFSDWLINEGIPLIRDQFIPWLRDELVPALADFAGWLRDEIIPGLQDAGPALQDVAGGVKAIAEALASMPGWVQVAVGALGILARFGGFGVLAGAATAMGKVIGTAFGFIGFAATTAFSWILRIAPFGHLATLAFIFRDQVVGAFRWVRDQAVNAFNSLRDRAVTNIKGIADKIASLPGQVAGALGRLANLFGTAMRSAWNQVTDWVDRIVRAITSIPSRIAGVAGRIKDKLAGALGGIDLTPGFDLPGFGGFLAHGGVIPATPGGRLFVAGEAGVDEAVIPLDGRHGMGTTVIVNIDRPIVASEREFRSMVRRAVNDGLADGTINKRGSAL